MKSRMIPLVVAGIAIGNLYSIIDWFVTATVRPKDFLIVLLFTNIAVLLAALLELFKKGEENDI